MKQKTKASCGGQGCSKDLFSLPYCGGKRRPRRRILRFQDRKQQKPFRMCLLIPNGIPEGTDRDYIFAQYMPI